MVENWKLGTAKIGECSFGVMIVGNRDGIRVCNK